MSAGCGVPHIPVASLAKAKPKTPRGLDATTSLLRSPQSPATRTPTSVRSLRQRRTLLVTGLGSCRQDGARSDDDAQ